MEIEAKFEIADLDALQRLRRVVRLGPFVPGETWVREITDVYLDTEDRALLQSGYACRIRKQAGGRLLAIKGLGGAESAIHTRFESEEMLPAEATESPETWPEGQGRTLVVNLTGKGPLTELFVVKQVRYVRPLHLGDRLIAELSLDQVSIRAGDQRRSYLCLEAELAGQGEIGDLQNLAKHLVDTWGLEPEPRSKFELGLALLDLDTQTESVRVEAARLPGRDDQEGGSISPQELAQDSPGVPERLTVQECEQLAHIAQEASNERDRRYAALILGWGDCHPVRELGEEIGFSQSWSYELITRFQKEGLAMFSFKPVDESQPEVVDAGSAAPPAVLEVSESQERVEATLDGAESTTVTKLCEQFQVDMAHARYVKETALLLFDRTESVHHLDTERRPLLAVMAMLHNVGLEVDPDGHHIRGRDIVLENRLEGLSEMEQQMLAAGVFLHRKRIRRRKLETGIVASLPLGLRHDALVLAALVRMADGLDYAQSQSTVIEDVQVHSVAVQVMATGPTVEIDVAQAQAKADLWEALYGDRPFFFAVHGQTVSSVEMGAMIGTEDRPAVTAEIALDEPVALKSPGVGPDDPMSEAGRKVLAFHFAQMLDCEPGTRAGTDIEQLHDMRVATRRMRSAFRVFAPYYKARTIQPYVVGLRRTARALGPVRDLDVFMQKAERYLEGLGPEQSGDLDVLLADWRKQREQARLTMIEVLDGNKYRDFVDAFRLFLATSGTGALQNTRIPPRPTLVCHVAPHLIYGRWASVQAFGSLLDGAPIVVLHALRIECKRLRYTLEFFSEVLGPEARDVIQAVVQLQDHLGDLNDADVANAMLSDFLFAPRPDGEGARLIAPGVVAYLAVKQRELQMLVNTFPQAWQAFSQPELRQALAKAVAIL